LTSSLPLQEAAADAAHRDQQERNAKAREIRKPRYQSVFSSSLSLARLRTPRRRRARARAHALLAHAQTPTTTMLAFDIETYGPEWTAAERKSFAFCALLHLVWLLAMVRLPPPAHARALLIADARRRRCARS